MLLIRALLLWSILSLHVIGGAALFRRFFPRESAWFGFFVPGVTLVLLCNFIEHIFALPTLLWLLPITTVTSIWALVRLEIDWKSLSLPAAIFLGAFAFSLGLRALKPDILTSRDGIVDISLLACYLQGEKLPPTLIWYPPQHLSHYYAFGHYGLSVMTRLLGVDIGTGFNLGVALLSAFDCLLAAAAAWTLSRRTLWITLLAPVVLLCAATGATGYLWFTTPALNPLQGMNLLLGMDNPQNTNPLWHLLHQSLWYYRRELVPPGTWIWSGAFHSTSIGQFLSLFFTWSMVEALRRKSANWPWICLGAIPLVSIVSSTWAVLFQGLFLIGALFWVWYYKLAPHSFRFVLLSIGLTAALLTPTLAEFLTTTGTPPMGWTDPNGFTEPVEFLVLWWPVYLPWFALLFLWRKLPPSIKTLLIILPIALVGMEIYTIGGRPDWTSKLWGYIFGAAWITFIPLLLRRGGILFRILALLLLVNSTCSLFAWSQYTWRMRCDDDILHLTGTGTIRLDPLRGNLLQVLDQMRGQTVICGKSDDLYCESPILVAFTGNRAYVTWSYFCDGVEGGITYQGANQRQRELDDFYAGKCPDPLLFLRNHDISALLIYPGDHISNDVVTSLKKQLMPYYEYLDFSDATANSGIFVFHPEMLKWPYQQPPTPPSPPVSHSTSSKH